MFCDNHIIITEKKDKKIHVFDVIFFFFENVLLQSISTNSRPTSSLDNILSGNFTLPNSRLARGFEIFLIDRYADIGNENMGSTY